MRPLIRAPRIRALLSIGIAVFVVSSCGAERTCGPDKASRALQYFPVVLGNSWIHQEFRSTGVGSLEMYSEVTVSQEVGDTTVCQLTAHALPHGAFIFDRYAIHPDGSIWTWRIGNSQMILPAIPSVGDEWITSAGDTVRITTDTTVTVPAGTFKCLKVVYRHWSTGPTDRGLYGEKYYARGVGIVMYHRMEITFSQDTLWTRRELASYSVQ